MPAKAPASTARSKLRHRLVLVQRLLCDAGPVPHALGRVPINALRAVPHCDDAALFPSGAALPGTGHKRSHPCPARPGRCRCTTTSSQLTVCAMYYLAWLQLVEDLSNLIITWALPSAEQSDEREGYCCISIIKRVVFAQEKGKQGRQIKTKKHLIGANM